MKVISQFVIESKSIGPVSQLKIADLLPTLQKLYLVLLCMLKNYFCALSLLVVLLSGLAVTGILTMATMDGIIFKALVGPGTN